VSQLLNFHASSKLGDWGMHRHRDLRGPRTDPPLQIQRHQHKKVEDCTQFQQTKKAKVIQGFLSEGLSGLWGYKGTRSFISREQGVFFGINLSEQGISLLFKGALKNFGEQWNLIVWNVTREKR